MRSASAYVRTLSLTPVKGLRIGTRARVLLEPGGVREDRRFYLVDEQGRMLNGKRSGALNQVVAELEDDLLTLAFPGGGRVAGAVEWGEELETAFFSQRRLARLVRGGFSEALSEHAGQALRLVAAADGSSAVDRGADGAVTLISRSSLAALERLAGAALDARRFRMTIEIEGTGAFEEDRWLGRELGVGAATVVLAGHVGRCNVTSRHPETGLLDLPTLDRLRELRGEAATTEPLALGVYGAVLSAGVVEVGDAVQISDTCPRADLDRRR
jgi:uncharacterized protein YcbX